MSDNRPERHGGAEPVFDLEEAVEGDAIVVTVIGDVDLATAPRLRDRLEGAVGARPDRVIVDLSRMDFIDSVGLAVLIDVARTADARSTALVLRSPQRATRKILEISGLTGLFRVEEDSPGRG